MSATDAHPEPVEPNCPEHGVNMAWNEANECYICPEPCGWEFHI